MTIPPPRAPRALCIACAFIVASLPAHAQLLAASNGVGEPVTPGRGIATITRGPYLQLGTSDSMVVRWRTDVRTDSVVRWGEAPDELTESITDPALTTEHIITLTGLNPGARYYYSVGSSVQTLAGADAEHHLTTAPPIGSEGPVRVWVIGDSGTGDDNARAVRDAYANYARHAPADVWITLGDNAYLLGSDSDHQRGVFDMYPAQLRTLPIWPTLGNHDVFSSDSDPQTGPYFDIFSLPTNAQAGGVPSGTEAYYSFDYANIHFVTLDTNESDMSEGSPMLNWLASDLAATKQTWLIAYFHHPPYSFGHNSDNETESIEVRANVLPMLEEAGVDLVLTGHSHSLERSYLLDGHYGKSGTLEPAMILDGGDGRIIGDGAYHKPTGGRAPREGAVFAVAGASGQLTGDTLGHPAMHTSQYQLGSLVLDIQPHRLDAIYLTSTGAIIDQFVITKGPQPCLADTNRDGSLNFFDISRYLSAFNDHDPTADLNADGLLNFFDVSMLLSAFNQGCP